MTRSTKLLLPVLAGLAALAAFWFLVLAPKREEIARLDTEVATQQAAATAAEQLVVGYAKAKGNYRASYTTIARLGKAVPADDDVRSLLVQLDGAAKASKVTFKALSLTGAAGGDAAAGGETEPATPAELAPAPGTVPVGAAGFAAMPFTFAFSGSFFRLTDFLARLDRFVAVRQRTVDVTGRLLLVSSFALTPTAADAGLEQLEAQVGATTYLVPRTEGATAGASPQAPAGAAPGGPAAAGGTASTTTATTDIR